MEKRAITPCEQIRTQLQENLRRGWHTDYVLVKKELLNSLAKGGCLRDGQVKIGEMNYRVEAIDRVEHLATQYDFLTIDSEGKPIFY